jgi:hypothetical protein
MYNNRIDRTRAESNRVNLDVKLFVWLGEGSEAATALVTAPLSSDLDDIDEGVECLKVVDVPRVQRDIRRERRGSNQ